MLSLTFIVCCINLDLQNSDTPPHDFSDNEEVDMTTGISSPKTKASNKAGSSKSSKKKSVDSLCSQGKIPPSYKLPNRFRKDVQPLLADKTSIMIPKDTAAVLREVATSIQVYTYSPTKEDYSFVVRQLVALYPQLSVNKDTEGKVVSHAYSSPYGSPCYFGSNF